MIGTLTGKGEEVYIIDAREGQITQASSMPGSKHASFYSLAGL